MMTQASTPIVRARGVPSNARLTPIEISADRTVEIEPATEAARPAILPIGSIDRAFRLPNVNPTMNITDVANIKNSQNGKAPVVSKTSVTLPATTRLDGKGGLDDPAHPEITHQFCICHAGRHGQKSDGPEPEREIFGPPVSQIKDRLDQRDLREQRAVKHHSAQRRSSGKRGCQRPFLWPPKARSSALVCVRSTGWVSGWRSTSHRLAAMPNSGHG